MSSPNDKMYRTQGFVAGSPIKSPAAAFGMNSQFLQDNNASSENSFFKTAQKSGEVELKENSVSPQNL